MIGLNGLIRRKLKEAGKLPEKYGEWKNSIYIFKGRLAEKENLESYTYSLFSPEIVPFKLHSKKWSFQSKIKVNSNGNSNDPGYHQYGIMVETKRPGQCYTIKTWGSQLRMMQFDRVHNKTVAASDAHSSVPIGDIWLRMDFEPKSDSTGTLKFYSSLNGTSWSDRSYINIANSNLLCSILIQQSHKDCIAKVSDIKFTYDGEVLFGS